MKSQKNMPLLAAAGICVVSVLIMLLALLLPAEQAVPFTPPPFEQAAQKGIPQVPQALGWSELDARVFRVGICGVVQVTAGKADLWLTNPEDNDVWLKLRILDDKNRILGETGLLRPGEYLQAVVFSAEPSPGDVLQLKIMAYEPETYYSAGSVVLNTTAAEGGTQ